MKKIKKNFYDFLTNYNYFLLSLIFLPLIIIIIYLNNSILKTGLSIILIIILYSFLIYIYIRFKKSIKKNKEIITNEFKVNNEKLLNEYKLVFSLILLKTKTLPVLTEKLQSVINYTDKAANEIINSFINIKEKASMQAKDIDNIFLTFNETSSKNEIVFTKNKEAMVSTINNIKSIVQIVKMILENLNNMIDKSSSISKIINTVKDISTQIKLLSLNTLMEASRSGLKGKGLTVVANEVGNLSDKTSIIVEEIEEKIGELINTSNKIYSETQGSYKKIESLSNQSEQFMNETLTQIESTLKKIENRLHNVSNYSAELSKDISQVVISIQFQDITRQQLEHVIEPLKSINEELNKNEGLLKLFENQTSFDHEKFIEDWLTETFSVEKEEEISKNT